MVYLGYLSQVTSACKKYGGFYLGSIGGPAAILAQDSIKKVEVLEYPELGARDRARSREIARAARRYRTRIVHDAGMEAVWKIEVEDFP